MRDIQNNVKITFGGKIFEPYLGGYKEKNEKPGNAVTKKEMAIIIGVPHEKMDDKLKPVERISLFDAYYSGKNEETPKQLKDFAK